MMTFKDICDYLKGEYVPHASDVSTVFENHKTCIPATHAYQKSRYGAVITDKQLLENFFTNVKYMIDSKNASKSYCGMIEVQSDLVKFIPKITDKLMYELGYKVIVLNDNSVITNSVTGHADMMKCESTFLLIIWNKAALEDVANIITEEKSKNTIVNTVDSSVNDSEINKIKKD